MKNKIVALFMAFVLAFSFGACSSDEGDSSSAPETVTVTETAPPTVDVEQAFLDVVHAEFPESLTIPDSELISIAETNCDLWEAGFSFEDITQIGLDAGVPADFVGYVTGAGTEAFCPEYSDNIGGLAS